MVTFGLKPATGTESAEWIRASLDGHLGTVRGLVPNQYKALLRVHPPDATEDWWSPYRDLFATVAEIGQRHTNTPDHAWFAIWEGHGFDNTGRTLPRSHLEPALDPARFSPLLRAAFLDFALFDSAGHPIQGRFTTHEEPRVPDPETTARQDLVPRFELPDRRYYLVQGSVSEVTELRYPRWEGWRNPDLLWPDDRRWFVGTDVDFWSLYIGGDHDFITELAAGVPTAAEPVTFDYPLEIED